MGVITQQVGKYTAGKALQKARELLLDQTPMKRDCGTLCGAACCQSDESGENGMLLYPFEEQFYQKPIEGFAFHLCKDDSLYKGGWRLVCEGTCPRKHRPLACRLFPLRIALYTEGETTFAKAELDPRSYICCPLAEGGGLRAVSQDFIQAVEAAGNIMIRNVYLLEALYKEQDLINEMRRL